MSGSTSTHLAIYASVLAAWLYRNDNTAQQLMDKATTVFTPGLDSYSDAQSGLMRAYYLFLILLAIFVVPSSALKLLHLGMVDYVLPLALVSMYFLLDASIALWDQLDDGSVTKYDKMEQQELMLISMFNFILLIANVRLYRARHFGQSVCKQLADYKEAHDLLLSMLQQTDTTATVNIPPETDGLSRAQSVTRELARTATDRQNWATQIFDVVDLDANGEVSRDELHTHLSSHGQVDTSWTDSKLDEVAFLKALKNQTAESFSRTDFIGLARSASLRVVIEPK